MIKKSNGYVGLRAIVSDVKSTTEAQSLHRDGDRFSPETRSVSSIFNWPQVIALAIWKCEFSVLTEQAVPGLRIGVTSHLPTVCAMLLSIMLMPSLAPDALRSASFNQRTPT
jgi:hypothetical protein